MNVCLVCGRLYDDEVTHCTLDAEELLPHDPSLEVGSTVAGRYAVVRALGLGQTGEIFEGREGDGGARVVLKLLAEDLTRDRRTADSLRRHLLKAKDFKHPGAVPVRAVEQHENRLLLVRDWIEGERLQDVLAREPAWPVHRALALAEQVCTMLAAAHKLALLHLQIRASNLFLLPPADGGDERVVAVDFGIGPLRRVGGREVYGTLRTLPPEQLEGKIPTFKSDIYSTGLLLHRLIVGASAFSGNEEEVARKVAGDPPPPLLAPSGEEIPAVLDNLVRQMVEKRPIARPPTMAMVLEKLQALRGSIPPSPVSVPPPPVEPGRPTRRERATVVMQALVPGGAAAQPAARQEPDTGRRAALAARRSAPHAAVVPKTEQPAAAEPTKTAPAGRAAAAVPAPRPDVSPEEGTTQEIQPEIINEPPRRPPPHVRPRPGTSAVDQQRPAPEAKPADASPPKTKPTATPGFGTLPAAEGEPPAEQTIDIALDEEPRPKPPAGRKLALLWQQVTPRQRLYAAVAAGVVLLLVVLVLALSGGGDAASRGADATVALGASDAAADEATAAAEPTDAGATAIDAAAALADAAAEQAPTDVVEVPGPADAALDEADGEATGEAVEEAGGEAAGEAAEVVPEAGAEEAGAGGDVPAGSSAAELAAAGNRALNSRQLSRARTLFRQALSLEPTNRQARTGLGRVAFQQGQFQEAVRYLEPLYRNQGLMDLGVAYVRVGRRDDARRQFEKLLDRNPNNTDARRALDALNR